MDAGYIDNSSIPKEDDESILHTELDEGRDGETAENAAEKGASTPLDYADNDEKAVTAQSFDHQKNRKRVRTMRYSAEPASNEKFQTMNTTSFAESQMPRVKSKPTSKNRLMLNASADIRRRIAQ